MKKSPLLVALPTGVITVMCPEPAPEGTLVSSVVLVPAVFPALVRLNFVLLFWKAGSKFVPVIVTAVPTVPIVGEKPVMVGDSESPTTNAVALEALPVDVVTDIGPVVAPAGTLVTISVAVEEVTTAVTPLNFTVFCPGVTLKPVP